MSTTPARYQATKRLIDDPNRLEELYCERGLTIREIADHDECSVGRTRVNDALDEYGITRENAPSDSLRESSANTRGHDPPHAVLDGVSGLVSRPVTHRQVLYHTRHTQYSHSPCFQVPPTRTRQ